MRDSLRRCLAALLAVALVSSAVAPVGTVSAQQIDSGNCSNAEMVFIGATLGFGSLITDCELGVDGVDPAEYEEAQQVHSELYSQALGVAEKEETFGTGVDNSLEEMPTIGKMEGKNAFIRSLENGSTKTQAVQDAREATLDYYAQKQVNIAKSWDASVRSVERIHSSAESEEDLTVKDVLDLRMWGGSLTANQSFPVKDISTTNTSVELVNGSSVQSTQFTATLDGLSSSAYPTVSVNDVSWSSYDDNRYLRMLVNSPDSETEAGATPAEIVERDIAEQFESVASQAQAQANEVEDFADVAYDQWDAGLINSSDLVDPYLGAREYSPNGSTTTWSERSLSALGILPPEEAEDLRSMEIVDETTGISYEGTLMSDGNPSNADGFTVGETYNATKIAGAQFVSTANGPEELTGKFTIANASGFDGGPSFEEGDVIHYSNPDYNTANLEEFKNLSEQIMEVRADLEARERKVEENASSGTGGIMPDLGGLPFGGAGVGIVVLVLLGMAAVGRSN